MEPIDVAFSGPFSWLGADDAPSIFLSEDGQRAGIYLWTVPRPGGHLIYYVGETGRTFEGRLVEHYKEHASGFYHLYSPSEFANGEKRLVWPGRYDRHDRRSDVDCIGQYAQLTTCITELTKLYRFHLAPLELDTRLRRRVEAAIALWLYDVGGEVGAFQDKDIHFEPRLPSEEPVVCNVRSRVPLLGLPDRLLA